jgi:hypothetical protein
MFSGGSLNTLIVAMPVKFSSESRCSVPQKPNQQSARAADIRETEEARRVPSFKEGATGQ